MSMLEDAGDVVDVLDMRSEQGSVAAVGGAFPEGSLLARTDYIQAHPQIIPGSDQRGGESHPLDPGIHAGRKSSPRCRRRSSAKTRN